jgi:hypothetical protein
VSVVKTLKDLCELAVLDQTVEDLGHVADAGIADDEPVRAPEVAACKAFPTRPCFVGRWVMCGVSVIDN